MAVVSAVRGVTASSAAQRSLAWPEPGSVRTAGQLCHAQAGEYCTIAVQCYDLDIQRKHIESILI